MRVFQVLAIASANRWLRSAFDQLSDQMSRLWVTLLKDREVPEQLQQLIDRWNRHIAGRQPEEIAGHLPQLIKDSGRAAREVFHHLARTPVSPSGLTTEHPTDRVNTVTSQHTKPEPAAAPTHDGSTSSISHNPERRLPH